MHALGMDDVTGFGDSTEALDLSGPAAPTRARA
jgi:hypothetical protein